MKKILLFITIFILIQNLATALTIYPDTTFYCGNKMIVTFKQTTNLTYLELGNNYIKIDNLNLSSNTQVTINISQINSNINLTKNTTVLRYNSTATATYTFTGNHSNAVYTVKHNNTTILTNQPNTFTFTTTKGDINILLQAYIPDTPYNGSSDYITDTQHLNLTWQRGNYSDREIVVYKNNGYPTSPDDGTIVQNSTQTYYNQTVTETRYYTIWSYNQTTHSYSNAGLNIPWGALGINVYNESNPSQALTFDLFITNQQGSETYVAYDCTNTKYLDMQDIPYGTKTVFQISSQGYNDRIYYKDLFLNHFYNFSFYLPPKTPPGGDGGNETYAELYLLTVLNEYDQPIEGAKMEFKRYINTTDSFENISILYTDANGQVNIYLIPNNLYKVIISKTGYITEISDYIPDPNLHEKIFRLQTQPENYTEEYNYNENITLTGYINKTTNKAYVNYTDTTNQTQNLCFTVYDTNITNNQTTTLGYYNYTNTNNLQFNFSVQQNHTYQIIMHLNHTVFGYKKDYLILSYIINVTVTNNSEFNVRFNVFGKNPLGWSGFIGIMILIAGMFAFGRRNSGLSLIMSGGIIIFLGAIIGLKILDTTFAILFIVFGVLLQWRNHRLEVMQ